MFVEVAGQDGLADGALLARPTQRRNGSRVLGQPERSPEFVQCSLSHLSVCKPRRQNSQHISN